MRATHLAILAAGLAGACDDRGDGTEPGAPTIRVEVIDGGEPVAAAVTAHDAGGAVLASVVTGPSGVAELPITAGGMITVAHPPVIETATSRVRLVTHVAVDPGDRLVVELPTSGAPPAEPGPIAGAFALELPPLEGADHLAVHLGCADVTVDTGDALVEVPAACLGSDGLVDVAVDAFTAPDLPSRLATTFARGIDIRGAPTVAMPPWISPDPTIAVTLRDPPAGATDVLAIPAVIADGMAFAPRLADRAAIDGPGPVTLTPGAFVELADEIDLEVDVLAGAGSVTAVLLLSAPVAAAFEIDGAAMLPALADAALDAAGSRLSWSGAPAPEADVAIALLRSTRRDGALTRTHEWFVIAPPETTSPLALPALPAALADHRPHPGDDVVEPGIALLDVDWVAGFDAFVADHGAGFLDDACVPVGSRARLSHTGAFAGPGLAR